jgi:hypothetical protein
MKVTKQEAQDIKSKRHSHAAGKKFKNISSSKTEPSTVVASNDEKMSATSHHKQKGTELSKVKHVDVVNIIPPGSQQDSINMSTETPVLLSGDGILRQVFTSLALITCKNKFFITAYLTLEETVCLIDLYIHWCLVYRVTFSILLFS